MKPGELLDGKKYEIIKTLRRNTFKDFNKTQLARKLESSYSHTVKMTNQMADEGILHVSSNGEVSTTVKLTSEGKKIADIAIKAHEQLEEHL